MTPLKVRGKRHGANAGQWHAGKKRPQSTAASTSREGTPAFQHPAPYAQKRRRGNPAPKLSKLEELPSEVLQTIFEYSVNLDLPAASPSLRGQLSSKHMFRRLTDRILLPFLECRDSCSQPASFIPGVRKYGRDKIVARRLLNSKFFTWDFFQAWSREAEAVHTSRFDLNLREGAQVRGVLGAYLAAPDKVFRGPWATGEDYKKLFFLSMSKCHDEWSADEVVAAALRSAIALNDTRATTAWLRYKPRFADEELLRYAVVDCDYCNKQIMLEILFHSLRPTILDPQLWSWAEKKRAAGDKIGSWLMGMLRDPKRAKLDSGRYHSDLDKFIYLWAPDTEGEDDQDS